MLKTGLRLILIVILITGMVYLALPRITLAYPQLLMAGQPVFRSPVVPDAVISGYFDHDPRNGYVTFYDGYRNVSPSYGFYFSCTNPNMYDFVGCIDNVSGVNACAPERQLWYDNHHGTDYEYSPNWYTGAYCDPGKFAGITRAVYAPARGKVFLAGYDASRPANGWHIRMKHDLNGNGNWDDDQFRSVYLHFTANALAVYSGQVVEEGQYLGLGGSTGYSSSPHLHFEVQRSSDYFQTTYWPVDPFGWQGSGGDPWGYANVNLFRAIPIPATNFVYIPLVTRSEEQGCIDCVDLQLLTNGGYESGTDHWGVDGVDVIVSTSYPNLPTSPYQGNWLAWLGGRNSAADKIWQDFKIPSGYTRASFSYFFRMSTEETGGVYDVITVNLRDSNGALIRTLDTIDNTFTPVNQWVKRSVSLQDLSALQGKTVRISFEATTDSNLRTSFFVDEVSWTASK